MQHLVFFIGTSRHTIQSHFSLQKLCQKVQEYNHLWKLKSLWFKQNKNWLASPASTDTVCVLDVKALMFIYLTAGYRKQGYAWTGKNVCKRSNTVLRKPWHYAVLLNVKCFHQFYERFVTRYFRTVLPSYFKTKLLQSSPKQTILVSGNIIIIFIPVNDVLFIQLAYKSGCYSANRKLLPKQLHEKANLS